MKKLWRIYFIFAAALLLLFSAYAASEALLADSSKSLNAFECAESPRRDRLDVMASMAGTNPVWAVDGAYGVWKGKDKPVKTAWVVARSRQGDLRVTGRRLDGPGRALFKEGINAPVIEELIIPNAHKVGVTPGGASSKVIRQYAFHPSYVIYPSPGCWELVANIGEDEVKIIINMRDAGR